MNLPDPQALHQQLHSRPATLLVVRQPVAPPKPAAGQPGSATDYVQSNAEIFVAILAGTGNAPKASADDWQILAFNGHVDLGTGIRTALTQIVAEELSVEIPQVHMVLGHTSAAPNQGPTIASASIQISAIPLRRAAAQAREHLLALAAIHFDCQVQYLSTRQGNIYLKRPNDERQISFGQLLAQQPNTPLTLAAPDQEVKLKPSEEYQIVGRSTARVDIPAKATGQLSFVHDVRLPGMRHGRVIRPPHPGRDGGDFIGQCLLNVDHSSVEHLAGRVQVVVQGDFVGVVADREEQAIEAMRTLKVQWKSIPPAPDLGDLSKAIRANPSSLRPLVDQPVASSAGESIALKRSYVWPYQMHASIGPSCAVASFQKGQLTIWAGTQNPHMLRTDLNRLVQLGEGNIEIVRMEAAGCYGRNCADDVCADAALLSMAVGTPVRVQLTREQENQWDPKGTAQLMDVQACIDAQGKLLNYDFAVSYPSNDAPLMALLLTGKVSGVPRTLEMGDRTAVPPYRYPSQQVRCHDMAPLVRSSWIRGVSAMPNSFAHDCMIDELAHAAHADPVAYRIQNLDDQRAIELIQATADKASWLAGAAGSRGTPAEDGLLHGRGVAYARYIHSRFPGFGAAWAAWVIDISVHPETGVITVKRIVLGQDTGMMVNPAGVQHQIHGNVIQTLSRSLMEQVQFNAQGAASREWGSYPIIGFQQIPPIEVLLMDRQSEPPLGAGESASVPGPAALANALFDATGQRFYEVPFTPDKVLQALHSSKLKTLV
ncbi:molybdopterin-dependent oxidoreductase [Comamonas sp. Y33R10-2]|uniref:xanthine dehydrogenase family protein molybdopterin-binding subunit n=1 Tax=Comamonas sp. Y33R10-2 TaxID=2853257 RepID=UPI001C5CA3FE|nr:molybdopterin cofactor-binding domain-containing protein [Comamonas sp. Y33R10-2]QXZ09575.1 molybdopterin-dependent oxidoreductase [Comamonas sp. Y33R10-2]